VFWQGLFYRQNECPNEAQAAQQELIFYRGSNYGRNKFHRKTVIIADDLFYRYYAVDLSKKTQRANQVTALLC